MAQPIFDDIHRRALWEAHKKRCLYCNKPLLFREVEIDHIIPKKIADQPARIVEVSRSHGLHPTFNLHADENLAPSCHACNLEKHARLLPPGRAAILLARVSEKVETVIALRASYERTAGIDDVTLGIVMALQAGQISPGELTNLIEKHESGDERIQLFREIEFVDGRQVSSLMKSDVEALLDMPVKLGADLPEGLELQNMDGQSRFVITTRDYRDAIVAGFFGATTFAMKMAAFFELPLGVLNAVEKAQPATASFIREPHVGLADLQYLSINVLPYFTNEQLPTDCRTLKELNDRRDLHITGITSYSIAFEFQSMERYMVELMRADLNGDGIEEMLVFVYDRATEGTFGHGCTITLSRTSPDGLFEPM